MDCFLDFCLACDKQTSEGLYCSQACRLADLEKAGSSTPSSPFSPTMESTSRSYFPTSSTGFQLPEAFSFKPASMSTFVESSSPRRSLSPSSSRSSLSSSGGSQSGNTISEAARTELQTYVSAFDQTREMKRRSLSSH
ncbi:hypothetical protein E4T42_04576 [Aureobasidium subglaciale]|uniref:Uncharacterized protein n=1 Tax=Aureobasidium subglaciale (strain EXF-2481) TaxID=1043005 RepID=A0A074Y2B9_AURSE|nr:uncharacterized protein AUEXF2481DRAFT_8172 [Aureobasidium subglaciale EXF-2481]KAI5204001.1 hypothetical protein E4T38_04900 [Aureobasidium subglaciale]KAI5222839.1 hypothetical protein E4T40_04814 [Aureobasidium subglaciale]KAI5226610.1 hypothetical protein E4T41_04757 [Aureobasidium subglaciale]KAI5251148.1 hypothetical protein E4T42_04576 [Aureobasidium subglaciale]KAI5263097.1 hypothetical protein E4T46_04002 [Aureobasidium subglaciale]